MYIRVHSLNLHKGLQRYTLVVILARFFSILFWMLSLVINGIYFSIVIRSFKIYELDGVA